MKPALKQSPLINPDRVQSSIRARFNPLPSLTPQLLSAWLESFRLGYFRNIALSWDALERRDYKLQAVASKRKKAVARHGWEILTVEDSPAARQQKQALEYFYNHLTATNALEENETGGLSLLIRQMMDAIGKRYAVHEIIWQPASPSTINSPTINPGLTATFRFCPLWWFEGTQGRLRFLPAEFALHGVEMDPAGWLVTVGDGIMEACSVAWMFKNLSIRDWVAYSEKFGMPGILGLTDSAANSTAWNDFSEVVNKFANDWSAVTNRDNEIQLIEPKGTGEGPFAPLVERMDRAITALWRGGDLGTMSSRDATGASLQADESDILELDDAQLIGETLTAQVSRQVLRYNFGEAPQLAYLKIRTSERQDVEQELKIDRFLLESGAPIAVKDALERYQRPAPKEGEALLRGTQERNA
jgi:phage gp29-like protein